MGLLVAKEQDKPSYDRSYPIDPLPESYPMLPYAASINAPTGAHVFLTTFSLLSNIDFGRDVNLSKKPPTFPLHGSLQLEMEGIFRVVGKSYVTC